MGRSEDATAARDFVLARAAACRGELASAQGALDEFLALMNDPDEDKKGEARAALLEAIDEHVGAAASAVQLAQHAWEDVDPKEVEPEGDEEEDEDEDDEE